MSSTDYKKLAEGCPFIHEIDARGRSGFADDKTWTDLLENAEDTVMAADPALAKEYAQALQKWEATPDRALDSPEFDEVKRIALKGQQILREFCNRPTS